MTKLPPRKSNDANKKYSLMLIPSHGKMRGIEMGLIAFRSYIVVGIILIVLLYQISIPYAFFFNRSANSFCAFSSFGFMTNWQ